LWTEVSNSDASLFKRDSSSNTIEGPVWWKIEGKTGWNLLASGEYTISNLDEGEETVESHDWFVPNYPDQLKLFSKSGLFGCSLAPPEFIPHGDAGAGLASQKALYFGIKSKGRTNSNSVFRESKRRFGIAEQFTSNIITALKGGAFTPTS